jgi:zinc protease
VKEDHRLPFIEFRCVFQGGVLAETPEKSGLTQLAGKMLLKGTATRSAEQIATEIEAVGGSIDSYGGNNSFGVNAEVMSGDFQIGLSLVADVLLNPTFPAVASIRAQKDQLLQSAARMMRRGLFGEVGYGLDALGTETSVKNLQAADLREFHNLLASPENCVLAIFGDITATAARQAVEAAFAKWAKAPGRIPDFPSSAPMNKIQRVLETRADKKQAVLVIGYLGTTIKEPDRYALELLQEACSDLGSRLFLRVRDKLGLAYYVGAQNFVGLLPGYFAFYVGTMPEKAALVEQELLAEAALLRTEGLSEEELKRAKAKVIGQKKIARQDLAGFAMATALDELYGLGYAHSDTETALYESVTLDQVKKAAQKYLREDAYVVAVVKPDEAPEKNAGHA